MDTTSLGKNQNKSGLYFVGTPIGNLEDMSFRGVKTLESCDLILCEDTRHSRKLLTHFGIKKPLYSYNDHNGMNMRPKVAQWLSEKKRVGLISDAGMPVISDPGYQLVALCQEKNFYYTVIPGPSAVLCGLVLSGLPPNQFFFAGFLPKKDSDCKKFVKTLKTIPASLIFYLSPHRFREHLSVLFDELGNRHVAIVREISKVYEEKITGSLADLISKYTHENAPLGELVLVIEGYEKPMDSLEDCQNYLKDILNHTSPSVAIKQAREQFNLPRNQIYQIALRLKGTDT